jgi:hypothetical protein
VQRIGQSFLRNDSRIDVGIPKQPRQKDAKNKQEEGASIRYVRFESTFTNTEHCLGRITR